MHYRYKLNFPYGVHFGADKTGIGLEKISIACHCDTFYSAVCQEILKLYGEVELENFVKDTKSGNFKISDLLPYDNNTLYLPKPILYVGKKENDTEKQEKNSVLKKKMKKLHYIPIDKFEIDKFDEYLSSLKKGKIFSLETTNISESVMYEKNAIARSGNPDDNGLYSVSITKFEKGCGLYFIAEFSEDKKEWFDNLLKSLGLSGIGGKRTSGYGQFEVIDDTKLDKSSDTLDDKTLAQLLENNAESKYYLTLSAMYPKKDEVPKLTDDGYYTLIQRQGFVASRTYSKQFLKRIPSVMINAGSCFKEKLEGEVVDLSHNGKHPVYRYGKPIMIGIKLCKNLDI